MIPGFAPRTLLTAGAIEMQKDLSTQTGLDLPATLVFNYPSVAEMCSYMLASMPPQAEQISKEAAKAPAVSGMPVKPFMTCKEEYISIRRNKITLPQEPNVCYKRNSLDLITAVRSSLKLCNVIPLRPALAFKLECA